MKIYLIGQKGIPAQAGGIERHVEELSTRLAQSGHEVFVYCRPYYASTADKNYQGVNLIKLPTIKTKHLDAIVHTFLATLDVLRKEADVIHYHGIGPASLSFIPKLFKRKARLIFTFHCQDYKHQKWGAFARAYLKLGELMGCRTADKIITVSQTLKDYVLQKYHLEAVYIPNGLKLPQLGNAKNDLLKKWGLTPDNYILTVNRLVRHKGIHHLIKAYQQTKTDKKLVIVGGSAYTDNYVNQLKELAGQNDRIVFTGERVNGDLAELFSNAYLYVHPSEAEGLSIAILEALGYGKTVLVSDIPENQEIVKNVGFLFKNKDTENLAAQLRFLLDNPYIVQATSGLGREHVSKNFNWQTIARETMKVYQADLSRRRLIGREVYGQLTK
ncbi:MAG TPA: glycosyltransferase family 4 protein [Patescibacteria group bacterium]